MSNNPFDPRNTSFTVKILSYLIVYHIFNCSHSMCISKPIFPNLPWLTTLKCTKDTSHPPWSICQLCSNTRIQYKTNIQIKKHQRNYHNCTIKKIHVVYPNSVTTKRET